MSKSNEQLQHERARRFDFRVALHRAQDDAESLRTTVEFATELALEGASARTIHQELLDARLPQGSAMFVVEYVADQWRIASKSAISQIAGGIGIFALGLALTVWSATTASNLSEESGGSVRTFVWLGALFGGPAMSLRAMWWSRLAVAYYVSLLRLRHALKRSLFGRFVRGNLREYLVTAGCIAPAVAIGGGAFFVFHISDYVAIPLVIAAAGASGAAMGRLSRRGTRP